MSCSIKNCHSEAIEFSTLESGEIKGFCKKNYYHSAKGRTVSLKADRRYKQTEKGKVASKKLEINLRIRKKTFNNVEIITNKIVNTIENAQTITGVEKVSTVIGGFHLSGAIFEPIIKPTLEALDKINPKMIVPGHCTGWKATHEIAKKFPASYIQYSVGKKILIELTI
ncbi:MAG: hypothetical protein ACXADW_02070 [Candidatus Hodarchaeales archaeon]